MRVLVTGGAGFIGSHLVEKLVGRGDTVAVLDNLSTGRLEHLPAAAEFILGDVRDDELVADIFREVRPDAVLHLAAQIDVRASLEQPKADAETNVIGTVNVLEAARRYPAQVVLSSTAAVYGDRSEIAREQDLPAPLAPYGAGKLAAESYLRAAALTTGLPHIVLRYANVYGPRQGTGGEGGVVSIFMDRLAAEEPLTLYGNGDQIRDFVFVSDIVDANLAALAPGTGHGLFNIATGVATTVNELALLCSQAAGVDPGLVHAPERPGEIRFSVLDPAYAAEMLGFTTSTPIVQGLELTWRARQQQLEP